MEEYKQDELSEHDKYVIDAIRRKFEDKGPEGKKEMSIRIMKYFQAKADVEELYGSNEE